MIHSYSFEGSPEPDFRIRAKEARTFFCLAPFRASGIGRNHMMFLRCIFLSMLVFVINPTIIFAQEEDPFVGEWTGTWSLHDAYYIRETHEDYTCKMTIRIMCHNGEYNVRIKEVATGMDGATITRYHKPALSISSANNSLTLLCYDGPIPAEVYVYYNHEKFFRVLKLKSPYMLELSYYFEYYHFRENKWVTKTSGGDAQAPYFAQDPKYGEITTIQLYKDSDDW